MPVDRSSSSRGVFARWIAPLALLAGLGVLALGAWDDDAPEPTLPPRVDGLGFPRVVDLGDGRTHTVPAPPVAIIPAAAGSVDIVCALVPPERVAAMPRQALKYSGLRDDASPYLALPGFEVYAAEPLLAAGPDLVLAHEWQRGDTTARLREAGVPVVALPDPTTWSEAREQILTVGRLLGTELAAGALLARYDARVEALAESGRGLSTIRALCYSNGGYGGMVAGAGTTNDELLRLAGLTNLAAEQGRTGHADIGYEELLLLDPDVFVVSGGGDGSLGGTARLLQTEPALAGLTAVREGRILVLESWLYTTLSQHLVDAAEHLQELTLAAFPAGAPR